MFPFRTQRNSHWVLSYSKAKSHLRWIVHSYVCCLKGQGNSCRSVGAGVTGKAKQDGGEHLLKCSPTPEKRWEARLGSESVACKMSIQQSMIKQTFDTGFTHSASLLTHSIHFSNVIFLHICLTCMNIAWSTSCFSSKISMKERYKHTKQMEFEESKILIITYTTSFSVIKSLLVAEFCCWCMRRVRAKQE